MSVAVMAHPSRAALWPHLLSRLPSATLVVDRGLGPWDTARRAWELADEGWHLVLQDDAVVPVGLIIPQEDRPVSLYFPPGYDGTPGSFRGSVAVVMPADMVRDFLWWADGNYQIEWRHHDDVRLAAYWADRGLDPIVLDAVKHNDAIPSVRRALWT